jgi:hypothetical protein
VALYGWPGDVPPTTDTLLCNQVYSDMPPAGGLSLNSTTLMQIQSAIVQTQKSNVFSVPSDCPTREVWADVCVCVGARGWGAEVRV